MGGLFHVGDYRDLFLLFTRLVILVDTRSAEVLSPKPDVPIENSFAIQKRPNNAYAYSQMNQDSLHRGLCFALANYWCSKIYQSILGRLFFLFVITRKIVVFIEAKV